MTGRPSRPSLSWPNRITIARIMLIVPYVIALLYVNNAEDSPWPRRAALLVFVVMAISDGVDGWLARKMNCISSLGRFLDPLADKLLITCSCILLALPDTGIPGMLLPDVVVVIIIGKDVYTALGFLIIYLITGGIKIVPVTHGKISTTIQLVMVSAMLLAPDVLPVLPAFRLFIEILWWSAAGMAILTLIVYTRRGTRHVLEYENKQQNTEN